MDMSHYYYQEENRFRGAAHAGSWYTSNGKNALVRARGGTIPAKTEFPQQHPNSQQIYSVG